MLSGGRAIGIAPRSCSGLTPRRTCARVPTPMRATAMPESEDARHSRLDADDAGRPGLDLPASRHPGRDGSPKRSPWQRLRSWLFNLIPVALSLASAYLMLYLLAKLTGLG
jgi:hypothetical protein